MKQKIVGVYDAGCENIQLVAREGFGGDYFGYGVCRGLKYRGG